MDRHDLSVTHSLNVLCIKITDVAQLSMAWHSNKGVIFNGLSDTGHGTDMHRGIL